MDHGLAGSTFGDLRGLSIVFCEYYGVYLGNYWLCDRNSAVFVITNNILPFLFFLTANDRGLMLSGAQRYLMDYSALLQVLKSVG